MNKKTENEIEATILIEIIYELYMEDIKGGKLKVGKQVVEKAAVQSQTFQWPARLFE